MLALSLALARPVVTVMGHGAQKVIVVLDTSASMKARDVSPSRFEVARSQAASLVARLGEGAETMVIESGVQPRVSAALGRDLEDVRLKVDQAARAQREARKALERVAQELTRRMGVRDAGRILQLSPAAVAKLTRRGRRRASA